MSARKKVPRNPTGVRQAFLCRSTQFQIEIIPYLGYLLEKCGERQDVWGKKVR